MKLILALVAGSALASSAMAAQFQITLTTEYSGASDPSGPAPWGTATFTDTGANTVELVLTRASTMSHGEFISKWMFNLDPALTPGSLSIIQNSGPVATSATRGADETDSSFRGGGSSYFDVKFEWPTGNGANRFDGDWTSAVFTLSMAGLNAMSFNDLGVGAGNSPNGLYTAAHIQGIGGGQSGWVTGQPLTVVPLPAAAWTGLAMLPAAGAIVAFRRRRNG